MAREPIRLACEGCGTTGALSSNGNSVPTSLLKCPGCSPERTIFVAVDENGVERGVVIPRVGRAHTYNLDELRGQLSRIIGTKKD